MLLTNISLKRPVFVTVVIICLIIVGMLCFNGLTINDMPEADFPYVSVSIDYNGASPEQLETKVAKKVEEAAGQVSGVKHIYTTIMEGSANIVVEFELGKSPDVAAQEVRDKISTIRNELPQEIDEPVISKFDFSAQPILSLVVTGDMDNRVLTKLVNDVVTKRFYTVSGVGSVKVFGEEDREIQIKLDLNKVVSYGLTAPELITGLQNGNLEKQGGKVTDGQREISLRTDNNVKNVEDFYNIVVAKRSGYEVKIKDVAAVSDGVKERKSLSFYDGKQAIGIDVIKQSGANTVTVADNVKKELTFLKSVLPQNVHIDIVRDNSEYIRDSVNEVVKTIIEGCILAIIIVFLFLKEWQSTIISAISLPTSIITTFIAMKVMGFSLNTMSLMALSLAVGLLIDDAIVIIENIVRHLHMGKRPFQAAKEATSEIGLAVLATTFSVVAVFVPIALVKGIIGKYFIEFGLTVAVSMLVSLFVSFTLVPMMSSRLLKREEKKPRTFIGQFLQWFNRQFDLLGHKYSRILRVVLRHRIITLVLTLGLFIISIRMVPLLGFSFLPNTDQGEISITAGLDSGLALEAAGEKSREIEKIVKKYSEVDHIYTTVQTNNVSVFVKLSEKKERSKSSGQLVSEMREDLKVIPGIELAIKASSAGPSEGKDISFVIKGENEEIMQAFGMKAKRMMSQDPYAKDVSIDYKAGKLETRLAVDREKASDLGVDTSLAAATLKALFDGADAGKFEWKGDRYNVRFSIKDEQRKNLDSLNGVYVNGSNNQLIPLGNVTKKVLTTTDSSIHRVDRMRQIELSANVSGMSTGDFLNQYTTKFKNSSEVPPGIIVQVGGMNEVMQDGFNSLVVALLMGILFMFMVMAVQFESYIDPISIMFALPMAFIGAVFGLFIAGSELSIMSLIGIILLMGLVAKNGILLVDFTKQRRKDGLDRKEALVEAGLVRLRPILMTTLAMIFGMIPIATATGAGTEMRAPMGHAVIGGLITSTLLTLFIVPVIYTFLDDMRNWFNRKFRKFASEEANLNADFVGMDK